MRRIIRTLLVTGVLAGGATPALADGIAVGAGIGTMGWELHAATEVNSFLALRANGNIGSFTIPDLGFGSTYGGIGYDVTGDLRSFGLVADFHPLGLSPVGSGFVLSGGIYYNKNEFEFTSTTSGTFTVGNTTYTSPVLVATTTFPTYAPYAAIGYDGTFHGVLPVSFFARAGVLFQGSPSVTMRDDSGQVGAADLASEAQQLEDDLSNFKYYPVLSVGLTISF